MFEMGMNTDIVRRFVEEQEEILKRNGGNSKLEYSQQEKISFIDAYVMEIMRLDWHSL